MSLLTRLFGSAYMAYCLRGQARYPFRPLAAIKADQARRVRRMVAYAYRYVPYYRETMDRLGLRPADFPTAEDLAKLPLLERGQLQRDPEYFVSTAQPLASYLRLRNSGTTARPCTFYYDARTLLQDAVYGERGRAPIAPLVGRSRGYRVIMISTATGSGLLTHKFYRENALLPRGVELDRQFLSFHDPLETNVRLINEFKPDVIQTYGSYLAMLFSYVQATGVPFHRPKALRYTSDPLPESARRLIEEEYHIPVFSRYEAMEAFALGFECERHTGLHMNIDLHPIRIVDSEGKTLPAGESGNVVISNLINRASVLLNYRLDDVGVLLPERCSCGRSLPLLSHLLGRSDDLLELASGRLVHSGTIPAIFKYHMGIWQYQLVQETATRFAVAIVADTSSDRQGIKERVAADLHRVLGDDAQIDIRFVDTIPRTPAGKVRPVISMYTRERLGLS